MLGGFGFRVTAHDGLLSYILVEYVGTQKNPKPKTHKPYTFDTRPYRQLANSWGVLRSSLIVQHPIESKGLP